MLKYLSLLLFTPFLLFAFMYGDDTMLRFYPDDAFYYLQTSYHFTHSGFISFDGVNPTNGFHPLYFLLVSFFTWVLGKTFLLQAIFLLQSVLIFVSLFLIIYFLNNHLSQKVNIILFSLLTLPHYILLTFWLSTGMEAALVLLTTTLFFISWSLASKNRFQSNTCNIALGAAITLFMLSRLDLIIVLPAFILYLLCFSHIKATSVSHVKYLISILFLPLIFGFLYLFINYMNTGHFIPVSGLVKQLYFIPFEISWQVSTGGGLKGFIYGAFPLITCFIMSGFMGKKKFRRSMPYLNSSIILINIGVLLYYAYLYFYASNFFYWYFAFPFTVSFINILVISSYVTSINSIRLSPIWNKTITLLLPGVILLNLFLNSRFIYDVDSRSKSVSFKLKQISDQMDKYITKDSVIGMFDAGAIGYFSKGTVVNLDGLANSFDYLLNFKRKKRMMEYFKEQGITFFLVRNITLSNQNEVESGSYEKAVFGFDKRIKLFRDNELFRYTLSDTFSVFFFKLDLP